MLVVPHELVALGLQLALTGRNWSVETASASSDADVVEHARGFAPRCILVDIHLNSGFGSGLELITPLAATGARVVVLTAERRRTGLAEFVEAGAIGWMSKDVGLDEVDTTLDHVVAGGAILGRAAREALLDHLRRERALAMRSHATFERLTQREALVLGALVDGLSAEEIAEAHFVAVSTVRSQIRAVLQKLGVRSQLAAVALAGTHRDLLPDDARIGRNRRRVRPQAPTSTTARAPAMSGGPNA